MRRFYYRARRRWRNLRTTRVLVTELEPGDRCVTGDGSYDTVYSITHSTGFTVVYWDEANVGVTYWDQARIGRRR